MYYKPLLGFIYDRLSCLTDSMSFCISIRLRECLASLSGRFWLIETVEYVALWLKFVDTHVDC